MCLCMCFSFWCVWKFGLNENKQKEIELSVFVLYCVCACVCVGKEKNYISITLGLFSQLHDALTKNARLSYCDVFFSLSFLSWCLPLHIKISSLANKWNNCIMFIILIIIINKITEYGSWMSAWIRKAEENTTLHRKTWTHNGNY
jgi:hypothetical protein